MSYKAIVADWNGTIFKHPTDEELLKHIGYTIKNDAQHAISHGKVWRAIDFGKLLLTKIQLKKRLRQYKEGEKPLSEVYEPYNKYVIKGRHPYFDVRVPTDTFAITNLDKVDKRILEPIKEAHNNDKRTVILSSSYDYSIKTFLKFHDFSDIFDEIIANKLEEDKKGSAIGFTLNYFGEEKAKAFENLFLRKMGFKEDEIVYLGDDFESDEPIAQMLPKGHLVVPFFADYEFKNFMADVYDAFVPGDEKDLDNYLKKK